MSVSVGSAPRQASFRALVYRLRSALAIRIVFASSVLAVIVAAAFTVLILAVVDLQAATERANAAKRVTQATVTLEKLVVDLETGLRGYALTGDQRFLRPWSTARTRLPRELASFRRLLAAEGGLTPSADRLVGMLNAYVHDYSVPLTEIARDEPAAAASREAVQEGRLRTDAIRREVGALLARVDAEARARASTADRRAEHAIAVGVAGLAVSAALVLVLGLYFAHSIAHPLREVATRARRIARGDFGQRLPERGPAEVGHLTRTFNAMADELARRERALDEQNAQLRDSERAKTELMGIVSHEVRTPLASVLGFTSLLLSRDVEPAEQRRYLEIIDTQGKRLQALLDDFLDIQRLEQGRVSLADEQVDMTVLLREQVDLFSAGAPEHVIELWLPSGRLHVRGDATRLAQTLGNLLSNAVKYSAPGTRIDVRAERTGERLSVSVRDRGRGIPLEHQQHVFTKFFRGDAGASGIPGTGLGLATSRAVVEAHGGRIGFRSAPGAGSTFWLELPLADKDGDAVSVTQEED